MIQECVSWGVWKSVSSILPKDLSVLSGVLEFVLKVDAMTDRRGNIQEYVF